MKHTERKYFSMTVCNFSTAKLLFEETIGFNVKASFASHPVSLLIKLGDTKKEF